MAVLTVGGGLLNRFAVASVCCVLAACGASGSSAAGASSVSPSASIAPDPLLGTWHTGRLTVLEVAKAVQAAGGPKPRIEARRFVVISMHFLPDGSFFETESDDGGPAQEGYLATYRIFGSSLAWTAANLGGLPCVGTYAFTITDRRLRLRVRRQCNGPDGPFNTALFATFPYTRE